MSLNAYPDSALTRVFPLAKNRADKYSDTRNGRLFLENNITNLTRQLIDTSGFVVSPASSTELLTAVPSGSYYNILLNKDLQVNLYGYCFTFLASINTMFFQILKRELQSNSKTPIYLYIKVKDEELAPLDSSGNIDDVHNNFTAVGITDDINTAKGATASPNTAYLHLFDFWLEGNELNYEFAQDCFTKFTHSLDFAIEEIDGQRDLS